MIRSGTAEGKQLEQQLLSQQFREQGSSNVSTADDQSSQVSLNDIAKAVAFKNKLIEFDRTRFFRKFSNEIIIASKI